MQGQTTFKIVRTLVNVTFYVVALLALTVIILKTMGLVAGSGDIIKDTRSGLNNHFDVKAFIKVPDGPPDFIHGNLPTTVLEKKENIYTLHTTSRSPLGIYSYIMLLLGCLAGVMVLDWLRKIFRDSSVKVPFTAVNAGRIRNIGLVLIATDVVKIIGYFIFNRMTNPHFDMHFELLTDIGSNLWMGLLLLVLAVVYRRGVEIYNENQLTI